MTIHPRLILALLSLMVAAQAAPQDPIKVEVLTEETAAQLSDSALIVVDGKQTTLGALKRQFREQKVAYARRLGEATNAWAERSAAYRRQQFRHRRAIEEKLSGADKIPAEISMLRRRSRAAAHPEIGAIRKEAVQLRQKMRTASPDEQAAIQRRAAELLRQVDRPR